MRKLKGICLVLISLLAVALFVFNGPSLNARADEIDVDESGKVILDKDVFLDEPWVISSGQVDLYLNGNKITSDRSECDAIVVDKGATLNIYNGEGVGRVLCGSDYRAIVLKGTVNIYGAVGGDVDRLYIDAIHVDPTEENAMVNVEGKVRLSKINVLEQRPVLGITGELDSNSKITVYSEKELNENDMIEFTSGLGENASIDNFKSLNNDYTIWKNSDGEAVLRCFHKHSWELTTNEDNDQANVKCNKPNCILGDNPEWNIQIEGLEDRVYSRQHERIGRITVDKDLPKDIEVSKLSFYDVKNKGKVLLGEEPLNAGEYRAEAKITVGNIEGIIYKNYTVSPATAEYKAAPVEVTYDTGNHTLLDFSSGNMRPTDFDLYFRVGEDGEWTNTILPMDSSAGEYDIYYYFEARNGNFYSVGSEEEPKGPVKSIIKPAEMLVGDLDSTRKYDGKEHTFTVVSPVWKKSGEAIGEVFRSYYRKSGDPKAEFTDKLPFFLLPGVYSYDIKVVSPNFEDVIKYGCKYIVNPLEYEDGYTPLESFEPYEGIYDGSYHNITVKLKDDVTDTVVKYSLSEDGEYKDDFPGIKDVTDGEVTVYFSIEKTGYVKIRGSSTVKIDKNNDPVDPGDDPGKGGNPDVNPDDGKQEDIVPKKGLVVTDAKSNGKYKIIKIIKDKKTGVITGGEVSYISPIKESKTVTIPADIKIAGKNYKVTQISANAFKNNKKLNKVVIGAEVKIIGKNAFYGCKNLKTVLIKSKKLTKIGVKAFKGINKKVRFKAIKAVVKNKKLSKKYIRLIKKAGCKIKNLK